MSPPRGGEPYPGIDWAALVDLADAIRHDRPHRMSAEHAAHVVDVLDAADRSRSSFAIADAAEPQRRHTG